MQQFLFVGLLGEYRVSANNAVYVEETGGCNDVQSPAGKTHKRSQKRLVTKAKRIHK